MDLRNLAGSNTLFLSGLISPILLLKYVKSALLLQHKGEDAKALIEKNA